MSKRKHGGRPPNPPNPQRPSESEPPKSNKRVIWDHFTDTVWLIALELLLQVALNWVQPVVPGSSELLENVHKFSNWFVIAALAQFVIESSLDLAAKDAGLIRQILRPTEKEEGRP